MARLCGPHTKTQLSLPTDLAKAGECVKVSKTKGGAGSLQGEFFMGFEKGTPELRTGREGSPTRNTHATTSFLQRADPCVHISLQIDRHLR